MNPTTTPSLRFDRGVTLAELLVTLTIFGLISTVLMSAVFSLLGSRAQTFSSQQVQDEFKNVMSTMELEMTSATEFNTNGLCAPNGNCEGLSFTVRSRPDLPPYRVTYKLATHPDGTKKLVKGMQRGSGVCGTLDAAGQIPATCFLDVTSDKISIEFVNFILAWPGASSDRPLITVVLRGTAETDEGDSVPLEYSNTFNPGTSQNPDDISETLDTLPPEIRLTSISPNTPAGCYIQYKDAVGTLIPFPVTVFQVSGQSGPTVYTNCDKVDITFEADDTEFGSGIAGGRYGGNKLVEDGVCDGKACSGSPTTAYTLPPGVFAGTRLVSFSYTGVSLKPGLGTLSPPMDQTIAIKAKDIMDNKNDGTFVTLYHMGPIVLPTTLGMTPDMQLLCGKNGTNWESVIGVKPQNPLQYRLRLHRCSPLDAASPCATAASPVGVYMASSPEYAYYPANDRWRFGGTSCADVSNVVSNQGNDNNTAWRSPPCNLNSADGIVDPVPPDSIDLLERNQYYTYAVTVVHDDDPTLESAPLLVQWSDEGITGLPRPGKGESLFDAGVDVAGAWTDPGIDSTIGRIPTGNPGDMWCLWDPGVPGPGPGPTGPGSEPPASISGTVAGEWTVSVPGTSGGKRKTNRIPITLTGDAYAPVLSLVSVVPVSAGSVVSGVTLIKSPTSFPASPPASEIRNGLIRLEVPNNTPYGVYDVTLKITSTDADDAFVLVKLIVTAEPTGPV